jgi:hemerythrin-like domain-containing protein
MPSQTASVQPNTVDMVVVHRRFRQEFGSAPRLVRSVSNGDTSRADCIGANIALVLHMLHHHHSGEDELVWPKLLERAQPDADLIHRMQQQHQVVSNSLDRVGELLPDWRATADATAADRLATELDVLNVSLDEHLSEEETRALPLIEAHLSVSEWEQLGKRVVAAIPKDRRMVWLGGILEESSPVERTEMMAQMPLATRLFMPLIGWVPRRQYRRYKATLLHGIPESANG